MLCLSSQTYTHSIYVFKFPFFFFLVIVPKRETLLPSALLSVRKISFQILCIKKGCLLLKL